MIVAGESHNFFEQHAQFISVDKSKKSTALPFQHHPQFSVLIDILSRKHCHHVQLKADFSPALYSAFLEALAHYLDQERVPSYLRHAELMTLNLENILFAEIKQLAIEKDFDALCETLNDSQHCRLIVLTRLELFSKDSKKIDDRFLRRQLENLMAHPKCRLLLLTTTYDDNAIHLNNEFAQLQLAGPTETDILAILRQHGLELGAFHRVLIPDELLMQAWLLTERYLSTTQTLEKALLVLDSSAARASALELSDMANRMKPVLTTATLLEVLSDWTQIPVSHLQINSFKHHDFVSGLEQNIFGQETALTILGHELLQAQTQLQQKQGPFSSFLFVGAEHTGKKTTAFALAEQLFKQLNAFYVVPSTLGRTTLAELKLQRYMDKQFFPLMQVIQQMPYAVIMFENIETLSRSLLDALQEILSTGYYHDIDGSVYNFRQTIVILSSTVGADQLTVFAEEFTPHEDLYTMDLMQLVMSDQKIEPQPLLPYSPQEVIEKITPAIVAAFSLPFCQHLHVVPFLPLNKMAVEKIIRRKLRTLGKQLDQRYGIELGYAPEVTRFLTQAVLAADKNHPAINPEKALKQLYFCVEQALLNQADNVPSNQLFLQLNETGHLLRCDWLATTPVRQHSQ